MFCDMEDNAMAIKAVADSIAGMEFATKTAVTDAEKLVMFQALLAELGTEMNLAKQNVKTQIKEIGGELLNPQPNITTLDEYAEDTQELVNDLRSTGHSVTEADTEST